MNRFVLPGISIAMLLVVFCYRIWDLAPTLNDDAVWRLAGHQGSWHIITDWAKMQGRVFAFVSGSLIFLGTSLQDSALGPILHIGAFAAFFLCFHGLVGVYFNIRLAMMTAIVNLSLVAIRWEGSIVTTYPIFAWLLGVVFIAAVYLGRKFSRENRTLFLWTSHLLLYLSLNIHEGMSLLFSAIAMFAVIANHFPKLPQIRDFTCIFSNRPFVRQMQGTLGVVVLYFAGYAAWRFAFPTQYDGNKVGSFSPTQVVPVLLSLSTTGSVLTECLVPYRVNFTDAIARDNYGVVYQPLKYLFSTGNNLVAILCGLFALVAYMSLSADGAKSEPRLAESEEPCGTNAKWLPSVFIGTFIAFLPVLPVAFVGKYQEQFFKLNICSYAFTPICHFGWSLVLASIMCTVTLVNRVSIRVATNLLFAIVLGVLSYCSSSRNDAAVADIRRETCRWQVMRHIAGILPNIKRPIKMVHAPRLQGGSWFTVVNSDYWSSFMEGCYHRSVKFDNTVISKTSIEPGAIYLDYFTAQENRQLLVFAAVLNNDSVSGQVTANEIVISSTSLDPSDRAQYHLTYRDLERGWVSYRFSQMTPGEGDKNIRILRNVRALPASIHIGKYSEVHSFNIELGDFVPLDTPVLFGLDAGPAGGESGAKWLVGGWHGQEQNGTWTSEKSSSIRVPLKATSNDKFRLAIVASTLTGLGAYDQPQTVNLKIGDRIASSQRFTAGSGWHTFEIDVTDSDWSSEGSLLIEVSSESVPNLAELGLSPDTRNLGVLVQNLVIKRILD